MILRVIYKGILMLYCCQKMVTFCKHLVRLLINPLIFKVLCFLWCPFFLFTMRKVFLNDPIKPFHKESSSLIKREFQHIAYNKTMNQTLVFHMCADAEKNIESIETVRFEVEHEAINDYLSFSILKCVVAQSFEQ